MLHDRLAILAPDAEQEESQSLVMTWELRISTLGVPCCRCCLYKKLRQLKPICF